jgi:hypothetical protein
MNPIAEFWDSVSDGGRAAQVAHCAVPVAFGAISLIPGAAPAYESQIITVVSIIAGLLFSMLVLLIDLRGKIRRGEDNRASPGDRDALNLDYAYYATNYTIITGIVVAALLLLQQQTATALATATLQGSLAGWVSPAINWLLFGLAAHFAMAAFHCLRRLRRCYEVFGIGNR